LIFFNTESLAIEYLGDDMHSLLLASCLESAFDLSSGDF
jgi:hypothetical protein